MTRDLDEVSIEFLQQRLLDELDAQQRLQGELKNALESERNLRLENDLLWAYLQREHPARVKDAKSLLARLTEGSDLSVELQKRAQPGLQRKRSPRQRVRGALGKLPGVRSLYHGLKKIRK